MKIGKNKEMECAFVNSSMHRQQFDSKKGYAEYIIEEAYRLTVVRLWPDYLTDP